MWPQYWHWWDTNLCLWKDMKMQAGYNYLVLTTSGNVYSIIVFIIQLCYLLSEPIWFYVIVFSHTLFLQAKLWKSMTHLPRYAVTGVLFNNFISFKFANCLQSCSFCNVNLYPVVLWDIINKCLWEHIVLCPALMQKKVNILIEFNMHTQKTCMTPRDVTHIILRLVLFCNITS